MEDGASFGYWIRRRRKALDLTQEGVAQQVGCAVVTIRKIESDMRRPSRQIAERLAECLAIPAADWAAFLQAARAELAVDRLVTPAETPLSLSPKRQPRPQRLKGYELREQLGAGGFGAVYRAVQPGVGREVAVKVIRPEYADHPSFIRRFEAEAQLVARLEHPHIVPLYDYWREPGGAYLVMRYLRGGSLHDALQVRPWPLDRCTQLLEQLAEALAFAHRHGVVHRDLKPANIMLDEEGQIYLADFGIAKDLRLERAADQTQPGVIVGSPEYLSPEQLKDEPVTPQTDIYCLGMLLYEILTGAHPYRGFSPAERLHKQLYELLPPLQMHHPERSTRPSTSSVGASEFALPDALNTVIQRATAKVPGDRYPDIMSMVRDWQRAIAPGQPLPPTWEHDLATAPDGIPIVSNVPPLTRAADSAITEMEVAVVENPYKGLRAFAEADNVDFFGRDALTRRLVARLAEETELARFLAVVGPSGSGKSSVVRAGLIPALRRGALPGSERWFISTMIPGAHPQEELEAALLRVAVNPPPSLLEQLAADERGFLRALKRILPTDERIELLLVIDQFEELFTLVENEAVRASFLNSLLEAVTDPRSRLRIIITLRADFYDRPLQYGDFGELVRERTEVALPLTAEELERAIVGPAARVGVAVEPELVTTITQDILAQPAALPLLQYALTDLFERRAGRALTLLAYHVSGGVLGALARRAEELYAGLNTEQQAAARQLFLRLVTPGEGAEDTRRRVLMAELTSATRDQGALHQVLDLFGRYRMLTFDRDPLTGGPTVEVAHEALLRTWLRLREWLADSRERLQIQRRLMRSAGEWLAAGQEQSFLASGARLAQLTELAEAGDRPEGLALTSEERSYLAASLAEQRRGEAVEQDRKNRELSLQQQAANRLRYLAVALAVFLVLAAGLAAWALNRSAVAQANEQLARSSEQIARDNLAHADALRLAAEANNLLPAHGDASLIALLSIRSLNSVYSPQGDAALSGAATLDVPPREFKGHTDGLQSVAFSSDGRYLATGSDDKTARLWDIATGKLLHVFAGHTEGVQDLRFAVDGKSIFTTSRDHSARQWDVATGQQIRLFEGHTDNVANIVVSSDGKYLLTASDDGTARLWDIASGQTTHIFTNSDGSVGDAVISPDGKYILTGGAGNTPQLWDLASGQQVRSFAGHTAYITTLAFSPDGTQMASGSEDHTVRIWDVASGRQLSLFSGHTGNIRDLTFSPDGKNVLSSSDDGTAQLWDVVTVQTLHSFSGQAGAIIGVAFSADGSAVATASSDGIARIWTVQASPVGIQFTGHTDGVGSAIFSPDGKSIVTASADQTARLWDAATGTEVRQFIGHTDTLNRAIFSPDGKQVLTTSWDMTARLWDAATGKELHRFMDPTGSVIRGAAFAPDGKTMVTASDAGTAHVWDVATGKVLVTFSGHAAGTHVNRIAFAPDGKTVATSGDDKTARIWDPLTGKEIMVFRGHTGEVAGVAFSPDGKELATASWDMTARLWDVATGKELRRFVGHHDAARGVAFSPDGRYVVTSSNDATTRLWDVQTGAEVRRLSGHTKPVASVVFSPDGKYILTASDDNTVRLWYTDYHDTIRAICGRLTRDLTADERTQYGITDQGPTCPVQ